MPCARMPSLMPALQPLSASRWQRATGVTGPWRSSCTPVVRDGPTVDQPRYDTLMNGMPEKQCSITV